MLGKLGGGAGRRSNGKCRFIQEVEAGRTRVKIGRTFKLEEIVEAHRVMEENRAQGKLVIVLD